LKNANWGKFTKNIFILLPVLLVLLVPILDASAQTTRPDPPKGLSATPVSPTAILLTWTAPTNTGGSAITGYKIEFKIIPNNYSVLVPTTGNATTSYTHSGLITGKTYIYKVSAINSAGTSDPSAEAVATPTSTSAPLASVVPNPPTNLSATAVSPTKINLSWTAPSGNGGPAVTGYKIEQKLDTDAYISVVDNTVLQLLFTQ
jgi:titin